MSTMRCMPASSSRIVVDVSAISSSFGANGDPVPDDMAPAFQLECNILVTFKASLICVVCTLLLSDLSTEGDA